LYAPAAATVIVLGLNPRSNASIANSPAAAAGAVLDTGTAPGAPLDAADGAAADGAAADGAAAAADGAGAKVQPGALPVEQATVAVATTNMRAIPVSRSRLVRSIGSDS
jgi:hypothetical protein